MFKGDRIKLGCAAARAFRLVFELERMKLGFSTAKVSRMLFEDNSIISNFSLRGSSGWSFKA
jgi:hypothetical protein